MKLQNKERTTIAAIAAIGSIAVLLAMGVVIASHPASSQIENSKITTFVGLGGVSHPRPPDAFNILVNGHPESKYVIAIKRGTTVQLDVFVAPKIPGITGHVTTQTGKLECSAYNIPGCMPAGITSVLSASDVAAPEHLILTLSIPSDYPVGTYTYEVIAKTLLKVPYQNSPVTDGDLDAFQINVI